MIKRYSFHGDLYDCKLSKDGDFVKYRNYERMEELCEKMSVLLSCIPAHILNGDSQFAKEIRSAISEMEVIKCE